MAVKCGIVGLPNVGKSTLFNALTESAAAQAANYPFCTIDPNLGQVPVPDERLAVLAKLGKSKEILPAQLSFVDIAGLVRGASRGEGLGNKFLAHIREVDAIVHVVRCFRDDDVVHVEGRVDPVADAETVETELMLADLESMQRRLDNLGKRMRGGDKEAQAAAGLIQRVLTVLEKGEPARTVEVAEDEKKAFRELQLLTGKPVLYACNVDEAAAANGNEASARMAAKAQKDGAACVVVSAAIEAEVAQLDAAERGSFLADLGLKETGLARVVRAAYELLHLETYFTVGPKETRAWTIVRGTRAPKAAGVIHTDFEKGFIRAETIAYADYVRCGGEQGAREAGVLRMEGKEYVVQDGDVLHFHFA